MGILIDARPVATKQKRADQCLVRVGRGGSPPLLFPLGYADRVGELIEALQTASLYECTCAIHGCGSDD
jgi:hypothetical protein